MRSSTRNPFSSIPTMLATVKGRDLSISWASFFMRSRKICDPARRE